MDRILEDFGWDASHHTEARERSAVGEGKAYTSLFFCQTNACEYYESFLLKIFNTEADMSDFRTYLKRYHRKAYFSTPRKFHWRRKWCLRHHFGHSRTVDWQKHYWCAQCNERVGLFQLVNLRSWVYSLGDWFGEVRNERFRSQTHQESWSLSVSL